MRQAARRRSIVCLLLLAGCGLPARRAAWPWAESRADAIRRSGVWIGGDFDAWVAGMRRLDLRAGPPGPEGFAPEAVVRCAYRPPPAHVPLGRTPKFACRPDGAADDLHVKYGAENGEVYAEVAGTRLLWALGFPADREYPVRVECAGCARDPWSSREAQPGQTETFDVAIVERVFPGRTMEEDAAQGWTWDELATVDAAASGAPRAHLDALRLLGAVMQHRDSKADNQRLTCPNDAVADEPGDAPTCRRPLMMIHDLGSVFGGPDVFDTHKMSIAEWERQPVWKDARRCVADVTGEADAHHGLERPRIGEEGRRFLGRLLDGLDDAQIAELFAVARGERRGGVARWVAAFRAKRDQVNRPVPEEPGFRCPPAP